MFRNTPGVEVDCWFWEDLAHRFRQHSVSVLERFVPLLRNNVPTGMDELREALEQLLAGLDELHSRFEEKDS